MSANIISRRTEKILKARSGGKCALCRQPVEQVASSALIISPSPAPNCYDNLVVLCGEHKTSVQKNRSTYTTERLRALKIEHESWFRDQMVKNSPGKKSDSQKHFPLCDGVPLYPQVNEGRSLLGLLVGVHGIDCSMDPGIQGEDFRLTDDFFQYIRHISSLLDSFTPGELTSTSKHLTGKIRQIEGQGFLLFGDNYCYAASLAGQSGQWQVLRLWVASEAAD